MNYKAASYGLAVAAMLGGISKAQNHDSENYITRECHMPLYNEDRDQSVPTAYSTMMQHFYDHVWSEPKPQPTPQVIIIHER